MKENLESKAKKSGKSTVIRNHFVRVFVYGTAVVSCVLGLRGVFAFLFYEMTIYSRRSDENLGIIALFFLFLTFPIICFSSVGHSLDTLREKKYFRACLYSLIPFLSIALGYLANALFPSLNRLPASHKHILFFRTDC